MPLPHFIIIGAMKAGTTSLHENLKVHPEIGMSTYKEPNYFTRAYTKKLEWYQGLFGSGKVKFGDASPSYSMRHKFPQTAERIYKTLPKVKLIYILRDPVDRIISHLHHNLYRDRIKLKNVNEEVLQNSNYITTSRYYYQISPYLKFFDREDILFVDLAKMKKCPQEVLDEVCEFIGVDLFDFSEGIKISFNSSQRYLIKYHDSIHKYFPKNIAKLSHLFFYVLDIKISRPILKESTLVAIKKALEDDVKKLEENIGVDVSLWQSYQNI